MNMSDQEFQDEMDEDQTERRLRTQSRSEQERRSIRHILIEPRSHHDEWTTSTAKRSNEIRAESFTTTSRPYSNASSSSYPANENDEIIVGSDYQGLFSWMERKIQKLKAENKRLKEAKIVSCQHFLPVPDYFTSVSRCSAPLSEVDSSISGRTKENTRGLTSEMVRTPTVWQGKSHTRMENSNIQLTRVLPPAEIKPEVNEVQDTKYVNPHFGNWNYNVKPLQLEHVLNLPKQQQQVSQSTVGQDLLNDPNHELRRPMVHDQQQDVPQGPKRKRKPLCYVTRDGSRLLQFTNGGKPCSRCPANVAPHTNSECNAKTCCFCRVKGVNSLHIVRCRMIYSLPQQDVRPTNNGQGRGQKRKQRSVRGDQSQRQKINLQLPYKRPSDTLGVLPGYHPSMCTCTECRDTHLNTRC